MENTTTRKLEVVIVEIKGVPNIGSSELSHSGNIKSIQQLIERVEDSLSQQRISEINR